MLSLLNSTGDSATSGLQGEIGASADQDWAGEPYTWLFEYPLPIPSIKAPTMSVINPVTNKSIDFYEITILPFQRQIYPDRGPTDLIGYDGASPGPTLIIQTGQETVIRFTNNGTNPSSVHVHGSPTRAPWDGWASDTSMPGEYKDYYYPNYQTGRTLWYHDHAVDITAVNAYFGQAGFYILHDPAEDSLGLPAGYGVYDIPLMIASKQYQADAQLVSPAGNTVSLYGDVIQVNGQPWPYLAVEPRKYRLRLLDAAVSRSFHLYFERQEDEGVRIPFEVIASDGGLLASPASTDNLFLSMGERYELVFDFSPYKGQNITLRSTRDVGIDTQYLNTDKVMRFVVSDQGSTDNSLVPEQLRSIPALPAVDEIDHSFCFELSPDGYWLINGVGFNDVANRVLAKPPQGTVEVWQLVNRGGRGTHPVHIHLLEFKILSRTGGRREIQNYESLGMKDVVWLDIDETVTVEAQYGPWDGMYMFHCHNLVHEDHDMMAVFDVTALAALGYNDTDFMDPMEAKWRPKPVAAADFTPESITATVQGMAALKPYSDLATVQQSLTNYWSSYDGPNVTARRIR